jgi:hypothetical protein
MARSEANDRATELMARTGPALGIQDQGSNIKEAQPSNLYPLMEFREDSDGEVFFRVVNYDYIDVASSDLEAQDFLTAEQIQRLDDACLQKVMAFYKLVWAGAQKVHQESLQLVATELSHNVSKDRPISDVPDFASPDKPDRNSSSGGRFDDHTFDGDPPKHDEGSVFDADALVFEASFCDGGNILGW